MHNSNFPSPKQFSVKYHKRGDEQAPPSLMCPKSGQKWVKKTDLGGIMGGPIYKEKMT